MRITFRKDIRDFRDSRNNEYLESARYGYQQKYVQVLHQVLKDLRIDEVLMFPSTLRLPILLPSIKGASFSPYRAGVYMGREVEEALWDEIERVNDNST